MDNGKCILDDKTFMLLFVAVESCACGFDPCYGGLGTCNDYSGVAQCDECDKCFSGKDCKTRKFELTAVIIVGICISIFSTGSYFILVDI